MPLLTTIARQQTLAQTPVVIESVGGKLWADRRIITYFPRHWPFEDMTDARQSNRRQRYTHLGGFGLETFSKAAL